MNLSTSYLGLKLKNPLVPSSSPLCRRLDLLKRMEDEGAAAVVLHSLFEEQITLESGMLDRALTHGTESYAEALSYFPNAPEYRTGPEEYLDHVRKAKEALSIPVIASLNGVSSGGWVDFAREIQRAGADALELNVYYLPADTFLRGDTVEDRYADLLVDVRRALTGPAGADFLRSSEMMRGSPSASLPVAVKLSPFFSALPHLAQRLARSGAQGLVLFNRFYQPDIDVEKLDVVPALTLSDSNDIRLPLRWIAILYGRVEADLALSSGVHTATDVLKGLMAGAAITMMTSELLQNGVGRLGEILTELDEWLESHDYESVAQLRGSMSHRHVAEPAAFERANYMRVLSSHEETP